MKNLIITIIAAALLGSASLSLMACGSPDPNAPPAPMTDAGPDACWLTGCELTPFGVWQCAHGAEPPVGACTAVNQNVCVVIYQCGGDQ